MNQYPRLRAFGYMKVGLFWIRNVTRWAFNRLIITPNYISFCSWSRFTAYYSNCGFLIEFYFWVLKTRWWCSRWHSKIFLIFLKKPDFDDHGENFANWAIHYYSTSRRLFLHNAQQVSHLISHSPCLLAHKMSKSLNLS